MTHLPNPDVHALYDARLADVKAGRGHAEPWTAVVARWQRAGHDLSEPKWLVQGTVLGPTLLHRAVQDLEVDAVLALLGAGVPVNAVRNDKTVQGVRPLDEVCFSAWQGVDGTESSARIVAALLDHGADPLRSATYPSGVSPLIACLSVSSIIDPSLWKKVFLDRMLSPDFWDVWDRPEPPSGQNPRAWLVGKASEEKARGLSNRPFTDLLARLEALQDQARLRTSVPQAPAPTARSSLPRL